MKSTDIPFTVSYKVSYALTNSNLSIIFQHRDRIYTDELLGTTSTIIKKDNNLQQFIQRSKSQKNPSNISSLTLVEQPRTSIRKDSNNNNKWIEPLRRQTLHSDNQMLQLNKQIQELKTVVTEINDKI